MKKFLIAALFVIATQSKAQAPTWSDDVACIVYSHCTSCHNANGSAPFSLLDFSDAINHSTAIHYQVNNKLMPPWPVDNSYRKMAHERSLSENERTTILAWINNGMAKGNIANAPTPPVYSSNLVIPNPDLKLKIPTYTVPGITQDLYRCFVMSTGQSIQRFITGIEIIPGNKNIVHHAQVFYDTTGATSILDANDPNPGYTSAGGVGTNDAVLLGTWVPGASPIFVPAGMGKRLPPTAKIIVQIHYPEYASGQTDSTKINFLFTSASVRNISDAAILNHSTSMTDGPLFIPKNTTKTFHEKFFVPVNATILSIGPHGHLLCQSLKAYAITLAGDTIKLVNIPHWNFHWQGSYDFQHPIKIPFGATLYGEATYDNTTNNPENPNDPPKDVNLGEATTDEMMLFYFSYLTYKAGDENIVVDTFAHQPHYINCTSSYNAAVNNLSANNSLIIYPNPANTLVSIQTLKQGPLEILIYNHLGQLVLQNKNVNTFDISLLANGIYCVSIIQNNIIYNSKLIKE